MSEWETDRETLPAGALVMSAKYACAGQDSNLHPVKD